ncbi:putative sphingolipid C4-monooxygenase [Rosa chinensis]|uniref:Putative sphingolipid C4-monooxygenase n=1 Tax=Rosa chinensis TaxID=74649 RepID=A0A2P6P827_ROSCH|nr:putative sphingolipid C4-monooxygenase [Rosa chinensis]
MGFMRIVASDEVLGTFISIIVYWLYPALIVSMEKSFPKYKIQSVEEQDKRNHLVSKGTAIKGVVLQQVLQPLIIATLLYILTNRDGDATASVTTYTTGQNDDGDDGIGSMIMMLATTMVQFLIAMVVLDTWQYFVQVYA